VALPAPGNRFPHITLRDEEGREAAAPANPALYGFFKTTCPTCEFAWPFLDRIRRRAQGGPLSVVAVSQDSPDDAARFAEELNVAITTLYDPEPWSASETLGLDSVPTFFLVDADGRVREAVVGFQRDKMEELAGVASETGGRPASALFAPGEKIPAIKPG